MCIQTNQNDLNISVLTPKTLKFTRFFVHLHKSIEKIVSTLANR
ncbi:hypothetical protein SAMN05444148_2001 [Winogradskyella jejuensis]|uniref:Uncharacterized protein n=1 Tax=Winogradskyella jejuensis TaxID=1089305 RepID=A0A1M5SXN2_9FLAO|nr:hypothetical protein SAMN05444148_2001 [Winogradskyella jejuensis]